jgi:hypothetical protein
MLIFYVFCVVYFVLFVLFCVLCPVLLVSLDSPFTIALSISLTLCIEMTNLNV